MGNALPPRPRPTIHPCDDDHENYCHLQFVRHDGVHSRVRTRYMASGTTHTGRQSRVRRTVSPYRRVWPSTSTPTTTRAGYTTTRPICSTLPLIFKETRLNTVSTGTASPVCLQTRLAVCLSVCLPVFNAQTHWRHWGRGRIAPGDTLQGWHPNEFFLQCGSI